MDYTLDRDSARAICAVALAASTDNFRPILGGICFEDDGEVITTDSYRLAHTVVPAMKGATGFILPAKPLAAALKPLTTAKYSSATGTLTVDGDSWSVDYAGVGTSGRVIEGTWPDWRQLTPEYPATIEQGEYAVALNPRFLATLDKMRVTLTGESSTKGKTSVRLRIKDNVRPIEGLISGPLGDLHYLLMPVRVYE